MNGMKATLPSTSGLDFDFVLMKLLCAALGIGFHVDYLFDPDSDDVLCTIVTRERCAVVSLPLHFVQSSCITNCTHLSMNHSSIFCQVEYLGADQRSVFVAWISWDRPAA